MPSTRLPFTLPEFHERLDATRRAMQTNGVDVLIVTNPSNMHYLTGYDGWSFYVHQAVIVSLTDDPLWWGRPMDAVGAQMTTWLGDDSIHSYPDHFVQNPEMHAYEHLCGILEQMGWDNRRIGVEMDNYYFTAACYKTLLDKLPNATLVDATSIVTWQRSVKSEAELEYMRRAARIIEATHAHIREITEPGMRKSDLVAEIYAASIRGVDGYGGDYSAIVPLTPSGKDAAAAHLTWDDRPLLKGEGTFFEIAGCYRRYHCPISRTIYLGEPPKEMLKAQEAVLEGLEAGMAVAVPGNTCGEIADAFFGTLKKHGVEKASRAGYSVGLSYPPDWGEHTMSIRPGDPSILRANMTFHFMPAIWTPDWGLEITETFRIREEGGPECLADVPRELCIKP
ncbi:M24 family metallopeptidase [Pelagibacterium lentulum]|uniref:Ectoine hydrolase DoeA n=1 Tax=Pelagibacterium lentulum TaxID=2029865 RepID=A0A916W2S1_9HYPH|nr:M24 family metallopeptidase [Pelagibacterium lentulum]GGA61475.1 ectoine hydrolase DoeA [Pelagibacterium lentulum]